MRQMTNRGYDFLEQEEGERLFAYDDATGRRVGPGDPVRGTLTIGVGHTGPDVFKGQTITKEESRRLFDKDTDWAEACVDANCPGATDNEFDALVSLCFNIGEGAFKSSSVVRMWKKGDRKAAGNAISLWTKTTIDGAMQDHPVLIARRARETALYFTPMPSELPKPMPQAVENPGKVTASPTLKAAATVAIPAAGVVIDNAKPALDAIQNAAVTVQQATTAWGAFRDALAPLANGHVLTVVLLTVSLVAIGYIALRVFRRIRKGEVSA